VSICPHTTPKPPFRQPTPAHCSPLALPNLEHRARETMACDYFIALAQPGGGTPPTRNWVHKKIPGCAVELNRPTQKCAWSGSQISLITAMSFREAMPPPEPPTRGSAPGPRWDSSVPQTPCTPTSKSWPRHCFTDALNDPNFAIKVRERFSKDLFNSTSRRHVTRSDG